MTARSSAKGNFRSRAQLNFGSRAQPELIPARETMANKILIPTPLRPFTGKQDAVEVDGATIGELLSNLTTKYEGLKPHLYNEQGKLRSFVNVYLNDEDIRYLEKEKTAVKAGDTISIIPSVAGGNGTRI